MKLLDRYVAGRFFQFFFYSILASLAIYLVVDPIENLDKFLDKNIPYSEILRYYLLFIPYMLYMIYPVSVLLGTMFCIGGLTSSNQLMAMTASGVPLFRHLFHLTMIGFVLSTFMFWWGETVVPDMNRERLSIWRQQVKQRQDWRLTDQGQVYLQMGQDRVLHLDLYQPTKETGFGVDIYTFEQGRIARRLTAKKLIWFKDEWRLSNVIEREFTGSGERITQHATMGVKLNIVPSDMVELRVEPEEMSLQELLRFAHRIEATGGEAQRWWVDIHSKVALPFAGVIIILFGVPVSAVRRRSGVIFGVTISLLISFIFFGFMQVGKVLGYKEILDPWLAAWIANIVFFFIGFVLYLRAPR